MNIFLFSLYNNNMKTFYKIILFFYLLTVFLISIVHMQWNIIISLFLLMIIHFIPHILYRIYYLIYIYLSQVLGSSMGLYQFGYYDKCIHFVSGCLIVIIANKLLQPYHLPQKLFYIFINCIEATVAFLWEIFEYCGLVFFQYDASRHFTTGVHDTMQDMIVSMLGGLLITFLIYKYPSYIDNLYIQQQDNLPKSSQ